MADPMTIVLGLWGLFVSAFTSATLLPGTSEVVLASMAATGMATPLVLGSVATAGNVLGSCVNWALGRLAAAGLGSRALRINPDQLERAKYWYGRYGRWSLLASWVPVIGDPLTVIAGILGEPLWRFVLIVTLAKAARYGAILAAVGAIS